MIGEVIGDDAVPITLTRPAPSTYVDGRKADVEDGQPTEVACAAQVTPATGRDLLRLPEGRTAAEAQRVLIEADQLGGLVTLKVGDVMAYRGSTYEVAHVADWAAQGGFYDAVATRVEVAT